MQRQRFPSRGTFGTYRGGPSGPGGPGMFRGPRPRTSRFPGMGRPRYPRGDPRGPPSRYGGPGRYDPDEFDSDGILREYSSSEDDFDTDDDYLSSSDDDDDLGRGPGGRDRQGYTRINRRQAVQAALAAGGYTRETMRMTPREMEARGITPSGQRIPGHGVGLGRGDIGGGLGQYHDVAEFERERQVRAARRGLARFGQQYGLGGRRGGGGGLGMGRYPRGGRREDEGIGEYSSEEERGGRGGLFGRQPRQGLGDWTPRGV